VPGGDVEELLRGLQFFVAELMHQGSTSRARRKRRYNISIAYLWEFVAFLEETFDVILQGLPLFLQIALQIPGVAEPYVRALEIVGKDLPQILPAIERVFGQVIEPSSGHVSQVDGKELNEK
jgi:hypothetical protein